MLRNFAHRPESVDIKKILERFTVDVSGRIIITRFEVITPDSFIWRIAIENKIYYLYAEDYVPDIRHVISVFNTYIQTGDWSFVYPKKSIKFDESSPVKSAKIYRKTDGSDEMINYAVDSGFDLVFLAQSTEYNLDSLSSHD
jgi:hypothetical protein